MDLAERLIILLIFQQAWCAQDMQRGGHDSCKGDSGGPLVLKKRKRWYLVGIVSAGGNCASPMQPGIYTLVSAFKTWISRMIWTHK
ncbi:enteropeptidase [Caerostris extrusa]|uniref:Enteropeptidase n=1 Tax=Caerostris extrusa TaxID=172846 RepID=A0AAV4Y8Q2_CAEEX|nr:enteropeptidase [Caerostris extrusa]